MTVSTKNQKATEKRSTIPAPMGCFLLSLAWFVENDAFRRALTIGACVAAMTGTRHGYTGDKQCIDFLLAVIGGLQINGNAGRERDGWPLKNEVYFQCSTMNAPADAVMRVVSMVGQ